MLSPSLVLIVLVSLKRFRSITVIQNVKPLCYRPSGDTAKVSINRYFQNQYRQKRRAIVLKLREITHRITKISSFLPAKYFHLRRSVLKCWLLTLTLSFLAENSYSQEPEPGAQTAESQESQQSTETSQEKAPVKRVSVNRADQFQKNMELLNHTNTRGENHWLSTEDGEFLAIFQPALKADIHGNVIIVPDSQQHGTWPQWVQPISQRLADFGWNNISFSLYLKPDPPKVERQPPTSANDDASDNQGDEPSDASLEESDKDKFMAMQENAMAENKEMTDEKMQMQEKPKDMAMMAKESNKLMPKPYNERVVDQLNALLTLVQSKNHGPIVMIGIGEGAIWATQYADSLNRESGSNRVAAAVVLINAQNETHFAINEKGMQTLDFSDYLNNPVPVLDIYINSGLQKSRALQRKSAAVRQGFDQYFQQTLLTDRNSANFVANRVASFITARSASDQP